MTPPEFLHKPTPAFIGASWVALFLGVLSYSIALWNNGMELNEKGYYLIALLYGLFAVISLQKTVRDRAEGLAVTGIYFALCWFSVGAALLLLGVGLWNAGSIELPEKGFYAMAYALSLFSAVAVQKNVRDLALFKTDESEDEHGFFAHPVPGNDDAR